MKKKLNIFGKTLLICSLLCPSFANAQGFSGGAKLGWDVFFGTAYKPLILGAFGEYIRDEETSGIRLGFDYALPKTITATYTANSLSSPSPMPTIDVTGSTKINAIHFALDYRRFFGEGEYSEGGFYGFAGAGLTSIKSKTTYDYGNYSSIKENYTVTGYADEEETQKYIQWMLRAGLGYDFSFDFGSVFVEARLSFPATSVNGMAVSIDVGPFAGIAAGIRF